MIVDTTQVVAVADLCGRAGAQGFEIAWTCPHAHDPAGIAENHKCPDIVWTCSVMYQGTRVWAESNHPERAANQLARNMLEGGTCRCGLISTTNPDNKRLTCLWHLSKTTNRWVPSCDVPPTVIPPGARGNLPALNRAQRRARRRRNQ